MFKIKRRKTVIGSFIVIGFSILIVTFQNCTDVRLMKPSVQELPSVTQSIPAAPPSQDPLFSNEPLTPIENIPSLDLASSTKQETLQPTGMYLPGVFYEGTTAHIVFSLAGYFNWPAMDPLRKAQGSCVSGTLVTRVTAKGLVALSQGPLYGIAQISPVVNVLTSPPEGLAWLGSPPCHGTGPEGVGSPTPDGEYIVFGGGGGSPGGGAIFKRFKAGNTFSGWRYEQQAYLDGSEGQGYATSAGPANMDFFNEHNKFFIAMNQILTGPKPYQVPTVPPYFLWFKADMMSRVRPIVPPDPVKYMYGENGSTCRAGQFLVASAAGPLGGSESDTVPFDVSIINPVSMQPISHLQTEFVASGLRSKVSCAQAVGANGRAYLTLTEYVQLHPNTQPASVRRLHIYSFNAQTGQDLKAENVFLDLPPALNRGFAVPYFSWIYGKSRPYLIAMDSEDEKKFWYWAEGMSSFKSIPSPIPTSSNWHSMIHSPYYYRESAYGILSFESDGQGYILFAGKPLDNVHGYFSLKKVTYP